MIYCGTNIGKTELITKLFAWKVIGIMLRPDTNLTRQQVGQVMAYLDQGKTPVDIGKIVGRTGRNIRKTYVPRWEEKYKFMANDFPRIVDWNEINRIVACGVQMEHLPELLRVSRWSRDMFGTELFDPTPLYRSIRWQSHILTYTNSIPDAGDIWVIGEMLTLRETWAYYMDVPIENEDVNHWLAYAPWEGKESEQRYLDAVDNGRILAISRDYSDKTTIFIGNKQWYKGAIAVFLFNLADGKEHLLPSQQKEIFKQKSNKDSITLQFSIPGEETVIREVGL